METWESLFLYDEPVPAEPTPPPPPPPPPAPIIWSPRAGLSEAMAKTAKASIERGKAMYVDLPCFTC